MKTIKFSMLAFILIGFSSCKKPVACIDAPEWVESGSSITIPNCSIDSKSYEWNMGDGTIYTSKEPVHTYQSYGYYMITLKANKGSKSNEVSSGIQVVGPAHKWSGSYSLIESCQFIGVDSYVMPIVKINETNIQLSNFLGGATIDASCSGFNVTLIPKYNILDASGYTWDLISGSGTINGNSISLEYTISDQFHNNIYGSISCTTTGQRQ